MSDELTPEKLNQALFPLYLLIADESVKTTGFEERLVFLSYLDAMAEQLGLPSFAAGLGRTKFHSTRDQTVRFIRGCFKGLDEKTLSHLKCDLEHITVQKPARKVPPERMDEWNKLVDAFFAQSSSSNPDAGVEAKA